MEPLRMEPNGDKPSEDGFVIYCGDEQIALVEAKWAEWVFNRLLG